MKRIKLGIIFLVALVFSAVLVVHAQSNEQAQSTKIKPAAASGLKQGYQMVTSVLDGFGGASESDNYIMKVNSGGQPSAIGVSEGGSYVLEAGYVHASFVMRGDASGDRLIDVADVLYLVNYLFLATSGPCPMEAGDATCDGIVDVADALYIINYLFLGTSPPGC
jgi:hypothetical protein